jgi:hypothetical protein
MVMHSITLDNWAFLLLNGTKSSTILPSRGLCQGDPPSFYVFILCVDVLARLVNREVERGSYKGC